MRRNFIILALLIFSISLLSAQERDTLGAEDILRMSFGFIDAIKQLGIFWGLVNNAIKFTREGSVRFGCVRKGAEFEFFVSDTGIGIPKEKQHFIFEQFRQVSKAVSDEFGGTGLGLAISKEYTEMLGGRISIESELGKGSKFCFTIPAEGTP